MLLESQQKTRESRKLKRLQPAEKVREVQKNSLLNKGSREMISTQTVKIIAERIYKETKKLIQI